MSKRKYSPLAIAAGVALSVSSVALAATYPADWLNLKPWKLTLPIGPSNSATEIKQPALATYSITPWFRLNSSGVSVLFRANAGGSRTSTNTAYARSELREMTADGQSLAGWSCQSATRHMHLEQVLNRTTTVKPQASIGQIHDNTNDNVMLFYRGPSGANGTSDTGRIEAYFNDQTTNVLLDSAYHLGDHMTVDINVSGGAATVTYKNTTTGATKVAGPYQLTGVVGQCYFKAGLYVQSCSKIDSNGNTNQACVAKNLSKYDTASAYAELGIQKLTID